MQNNQSMHGSYLRFFAMIGTAMIAMVILMYTHSYKIIEAQRKEIKEMEWLIEDIRDNGVAETQNKA